MMRNRLMMRTMAAGRAGRLRVALALAVAGALSGCGGGSMFGASSDSSPSISDRFGQLFGSKSQAVGEAPPAAVDNELTCPSVSIRAGASTYAVAALALVRAKEPVAVILDVQMPGGGGLAALAKIKADPLMAKLPVMMLTGERNPEIVMQAMTGGADDYMVKPFNPDILLERIGRMVKSSAMVWGQPPATEIWEL